MKYLLFAFLALLSIVPASAQWAPPRAPHFESIDLPAINSNVIATGNLAELPAEKDNYLARELLITVRETLKGPAQKQVRVLCNQRDEVLAKWKSEGALLLVALPAKASGQPTLINLSDPALAVLTADLKLLRKPEDVLHELKRRIHGSTSGQFTLAVPVEKVKGTVLQGADPKYYPNVHTDVPIDGQLEENARRGALSKDSERRINGAMALSYFNTPRNIDFLKSLLGDNGWQEAIIEKKGRVLRFSHNDLRRQAYASLKNLNVNVKEPATMLPQSENDQVIIATLDRGKVTPEDIDELVHFKKLENLYLSNAQLTPEEWAKIGQLKSLKLLFLESSNVTDNDLKHLARLPRLAYLGLGNTSITDVGLLELAKFRRLKKVDLGQVVTDSGIAKLRQLRPDMLVRPDEFAFLAPLHPRRVEQPYLAARNYFMGQLGLDGPGIRSYLLIFPADVAGRAQELINRNLPDHYSRRGVPVVSRSTSRAIDQVDYLAYFIDESNRLGFSSTLNAGDRLIGITWNVDPR